MLTWPYDVNMSIDWNCKFFFKFFVLRIYQLGRDEIPDFLFLTCMFKKKNRDEIPDFLFRTCTHVLNKKSGISSLYLA